MSLPPRPGPSQPLAGPGPSSLAFASASSSQNPYPVPPPPFAATSSSIAYYDPAVAVEEHGELELPTPPATFFQLGGRSDTTGAGKGKRRAEYQPSSGAESDVDSTSAAAALKGKKRARCSPPPPPPAPSSTAPPQPRGRHLPLSARIDAAGGLDKLQGTRFRFRQVGGPKGVVVPLLPEEVRGRAEAEEGGEEERVEVEELLERVKDPAFSSALIASLTADEQRYAVSYEALATALANAQEEERVLNEVKRIVVAQRDTLRYGPQTRRAKAGGE